MALYFKTGSALPIDVKPHNENTFELEELRTLVGGHIEIIRLDDNHYLVIDEEGKLKGKDPNQYCTMLAHESNAIFESDYIVGDALLCDISEIE